MRCAQKQKFVPLGRAHTQHNSRSHLAKGVPSTAAPEGTKLGGENFRHGTVCRRPICTIIIILMLVPTTFRRVKWARHHLTAQTLCQNYLRQCHPSPYPAHPSLNLPPPPPPHPPPALNGRHAVLSGTFRRVAARRAVRARRGCSQKRVEP